VDVSKVRRAAKGLGIAAKAANPAFDAMVATYAANALQAVKAGTPVLKTPSPYRPVPGEFRRSWRLVQSGAITYRLVSDFPAATMVIGGTKPHDIYPRIKKALYWPGATHPVKMVHHPGAKPNPFVKVALASVRFPRKPSSAGGGKSAPSVPHGPEPEGIAGDVLDAIFAALGSLSLIGLLAAALDATIQESGAAR